MMMAQRKRKRKGKGRGSSVRGGTDADITAINAVFDDGMAEAAYGGVRPVQGLALDKMKKFERNRKIVKNLGIILIVAGLFVLVASYFNAYNASKDREAAETPTYKVRHDSLGAQIVTNYLMGLPPPNVMLGSEVVWPQGGGTSAVSDTETDPDKLQQIGVPENQDEVPTISGVTLDHGERKDFPLDHNAKLPDPEPFMENTQEEVLRYYLIMNGQPLMMSVNLLVPPKEDTTTPPVLLNTPSFVEMPEQNEGGVTVKSAPSAIPDMAKYSGKTDGLDAVLARFAKAWAENDQATLLALTQDAQGRKYAGLGGWESGGNVNIDWVYQRVPDMTTDGSAYVQATFTIKQKVTPETSSGDDESLDPKEFTMTQTMDFLVHDVGGGLPAIVAWGPAGTWHNLEPYGNARDKEKSPEQVEGTGVRSPEDDSSAPQQGAPTSSSGGSGGGSSATSTERGDAFDAPPIDIGSGGGSPSESATTSEDLGVDDELCKELGVC